MQNAKPKPLRVRCKLDTLRDVQRELARLYRAARGRGMDVADASKLANILGILARVTTSADLELAIKSGELAERLAALERVNRR